MVVVTPTASLAGIAWIRTVRPSADGCAGMTAAMPGPSAKALGTTVDRLRTELPPAVQVGGAAAENHALEKALAAVTPLVLGIVLGLGFLLLVALQAPLAAALSVVTNLLAVGAAFGVGRLIFQDGHGAGSSASPARATWTRGRRCSSSR
jgi:RND superfamily putative drug exporter